MLEYLIELDQSVTLFINGLNTPFLDNFFFIYTDLKTWIPLLLLLLVVMYRQYGWRFIYLIIAFALAILIADQISSSLIKPLVARYRPTHNPDFANLIHIVNGYRGGKYGFVSSHAANSFAFALLASLIFKRKSFTISFMFWATFTALSRTYLGVHWAGDIVCGAIIGVLIAFLLYFVLRKLSIKYDILPEKPLERFNNILIVSGLVVLHLAIVVIALIV